MRLTVDIYHTVETFGQLAEVLENLAAELRSRPVPPINGANTYDLRGNTWDNRLVVVGQWGIDTTPLTVFSPLQEVARTRDGAALRRGV